MSVEVRVDGSLGERLDRFKFDQSQLTVARPHIARIMRPVARLTMVPADDLQA